MAGSRKLLVDAQAISPVWRITDAAVAAIRGSAPPGWMVHVAQSPTSSDGDGGKRPAGEILREIADAEVYLGFGISRELFLAAPRLRWIHTISAGVGSVLFDEVREGAVLLTNSAGLYGPPIAEHVLGALLYFLRCFDVAVEHMRRNSWDKSEMADDRALMREISGTSVLIFGAGGIGTEVALRVSALGGRCVGVRRNPGRGAPPGFERVVGMHALDEELGAADAIVLCAPATGETVGVLNEGRIALLRPGAIVVNVARGSLVDEQALARALREGRIRGAFLDVAAAEPLSPDSPLWQERSALVTPHVSGVAPASFWIREAELFLDNWRRYVAGEPLRNLVDKQAGY